eukprot:gene2457-3167_t
MNKLKTLTNLIEKSEYIVVFTGAGISTSMGIKDFRGPSGIWTLEKKGIKDPLEGNFKGFENISPSLTHMAIVGLLNNDKVKYVVSQNIDGLHLRSGVPEEKLSELHGNITQETCRKCGKKYNRDFDVGTIGFKKTGRNCVIETCKGELHDTLLDWDDELPENDLLLAESHLKKADLVLCLGTSLRVQPANQLPLLTLKNDGNLVICTLQKTPIDEFANLILHTKVDEIMSHIMEHLNINIPIYENTKTFNVSLIKKKLRIETIEGFSCTFIEKVKIENEEIQFPFEFEIKNEKIELEIHFIENYSQKVENLKITLKNNETQKFSIAICHFDYNQSLKRKQPGENHIVNKKLKIEK